MRIVIDLQGAQSTGSRQRGIGRYSLALTQSILMNKGKHEVFIMLNGLFPKSIDSIRETFKDLLPQKNIKVWYAPGPVNSADPKDDDRRRRAELIREASIASLDPDMVLLTSLFEGGDDAVTSIGLFDSSVPTAVILYDLIPLIYRDTYLNTPQAKAWYEEKLAYLKKSSLLLAISESSKQESIDYLDFDPSAVINISTAADSHFSKLPVSQDAEQRIRERYALHKPFVMYTGGIDHRKNIDGLIRAYSKLSIQIREKHLLAVVCSVRENDRYRLKKMSKEFGLEEHELVLTGYVTDDEMLTLYGLCEVFIFPSWHEGFGLPALEAMSCGRAVIASNCSSLPEVVGLNEALFNPHVDDSMCEKLSEVLTDPTFKEKLERHGIERAKLFSWENSANKAIKAIEAWSERQEKGYVSSPIKPKLAYVSPLPPEQSGISYYSSDLLPHLNKYYEVELITNQPVDDLWATENCNLRSIDWFVEHSEKYDRILYHFGNSHFHEHMYDLLEKIPGTVVLHDFFLSDSLAHMDLHGFSDRWSRELLDVGGPKALAERTLAEKVPRLIEKFPANQSVLNNATGVIVHTKTAKLLAERWYGAGAADSWSVISLLRKTNQSGDKAGSRLKLQLNQYDFVVCSFGLLGSSKLNHRLVEAWLESELSQHERCILVFVGENNTGDYGQSIITTKGDCQNIKITGWVSTESYHDYLVSADLCVQLRGSSRGETSAALLDCLAYGHPTIINCNGSMTEMPDNIVYKLRDKFDTSELVDALELLSSNLNVRKKLSKTAKQYIQTHHSPDKCSKDYFEAIEKGYHQSKKSLKNLLAQIAGTSLDLKKESIYSLARDIDRSVPDKYRCRQILVDISVILSSKTNPESYQAITNLLSVLMGAPLEAVRIEPVYFIESGKNVGFYYGRRFALNYLGCPKNTLIDVAIDEPVEYRPHDIFLGSSVSDQTYDLQKNFHKELRRSGVEVHLLDFESIELVAHLQECLAIHELYPNNSDGVNFGLKKIIEMLKEIGITSLETKQIEARVNSD